jgi:hypothetical protein
MCVKAVGMGSDKMDDSLMMLVYADSTGNNITLSPRLSSGNVEPSYTSNITVNVLPGTGISNGVYMVNAMCKNCRSWKGGSVDPTSTSGKFIFAAGPGGRLNTNDLSANIKRHSVYGTFTMDLTKALGASGVPIANTADRADSIQTEIKTDHDFSSAFHGCLMILAFVGLMPIGIMILRIMNSPKWHGWNQALSAAIALLGVMLGIYSGTMYNRVRPTLVTHPPKLVLTNVTDQELGICPSNLWHHNHGRDDCTICAWLPPPQDLQTHSRNHQVGSHSRLARSPCHSLRSCQRLPRFSLGPKRQVQLGTPGPCSSRGHRLRAFWVLEMAP